MKVEKIGASDTGGRPYVLIYLEGGSVIVQRIKILTISEDHLTSTEELILALCEKIRPGCSTSNTRVE